MAPWPGAGPEQLGEITREGQYLMNKANRKQYRRPSDNQYTGNDVFEDVAIGYLAYPSVSSDTWPLVWPKPLLTYSRP